MAAEGAWTSSSSCVSPVSRTDATPTSTCSSFRELMPLAALLSQAREGSEFRVLDNRSSIFLERLRAGVHRLFICSEHVAAHFATVLVAVC